MISYWLETVWKTWNAPSPGFVRCSLTDFGEGYNNENLRTSSFVNDIFLMERVNTFYDLNIFLNEFFFTREERICARQQE